MSVSAETPPKDPMSMARPVSGAERLVLSRAFARFDPIALGVAVGAIGGAGLFLLTAVLLLRGGIWVGMHLGRLSFYLPGYDVTWPGAFVGLVEGGAAGFVAGVGLATVWNAYHRVFVALVVARERNRELRRELQEL